MKTSKTPKLVILSAAAVVGLSATQIVVKSEKVADGARTGAESLTIVQSANNRVQSDRG